MSETAILWIFGAVIGLQTALVGAIATALWVHVGHCKETATTLASIKTGVERIKEDIGDHERGIRKDIREHTRDLFKIDARVETLERAEDER